MNRPTLAVIVSSVLVACAPSANQSQTLKGLSASVTITRDQWGVPHIRAANDLDVFFAQGYVHAQDRLWQMELNRRTGAGRLSEILGSAALEQDKFLRTWGFYRAAQSAYPALSDRSKAILDAYAAGVNAFITKGSLPLEFGLLGAKPEPWQPTDSLVWAKMLAFDLGADWSDEISNTATVAKIGLDGLNEMNPRPLPGTPTIVRLEEYKGAINSSVLLPSPISMRPSTLATLERVAAIGRGLPVGGFDREAMGSNNWVIGGSRTATGKPMLANDPHLRLSAPSLWYLVDLQGDALKVIGTSLPGIPSVVIGRNDRIGWGVTNSAPDTQDLFILDVKDGAYATPQGAVKLEAREEVIKVKDSADVKITVRSSAYGPVISDVPTGGASTVAKDGQAVALRWTALEPGDTTLEAFLGINYARNWPEFRESLRRYVGPMQNFVYADVDGNIGYFAPGKIPVRDWDGRLPASAAKGQNWQGFVPFDDLPQLTNPREGFIVTANNKILPHQAATEFTTYAEHYRAQRIRERILETPKMTLDTMRDIQADTLSIPARELVPGLLALSPKSDAAKRLQAAVRAWDLRAPLRTTGATAFAFYYRELARIFEDELGRRYYNYPLFLIPALRDGSRFCDDTRTPAKESCAEFMANALEKGAAALEAQLGSDPSLWQWERIHRTVFNATIGSAPIIGPILNRSIANNGNILTVNVASYNQDTFIQTSGPSYRHVLDFADLNASGFMHPMGQSGDPFSSHYDDFLPLWRDVKTIPMSTLEKDWGKVEVMQLRP